MSVKVHREDGLEQGATRLLVDRGRYIAASPQPPNPDCSIDGASQAGRHQRL